MLDDQSVLAENSPDGGQEFEEIEYLEIEHDELAASTTTADDESLEATTIVINERFDVSNDHDPLAAGPSVVAENAEENQPDNEIQTVSVKDESFDMNLLHASLNDSETGDSTDCMIVAEYYIQDGTDIHEIKNWSLTKIHLIISHSFNLIIFFIFTTYPYRNVSVSKCIRIESV